MFAILSLQFECVNQLTAYTPADRALVSNSPSIITITKTGSTTVVGISADIFKVSINLVNAQANVIFSLQGSTKTTSVNIDNTDCGGNSGQSIIQSFVVYNSVCPSNNKCTSDHDKQVIEAFNSKSGLVGSFQNYIENASPKPQVFVPPIPTSRNQLNAEMQVLYCMQCADMSPYLKLDWFDDAPAAYLAVEDREGTSQEPVMNVSSPYVVGINDGFRSMRRERRSGLSDFSLRNSLQNSIIAGNLCGESTTVCRIPNSRDYGTGGIFSPLQLRQWIDSVGGLEGVYAKQQNIIIIASVCGAAALAVVVAVVVVVLIKRNRKLKVNVQRSEDMGAMKQFVV